MIQHILQLIVNSWIATFLLLPISALDIYYISTFNKYVWYINLPVLLIIDIFMAFLLIKFGYLISHLVIKSDKNKAKLAKWSDKFSKWGFWGLLIAASTPLPYSLFLYTQGATRIIKYPMVAVAIGRTIKYGVITALLLLGYAHLLPT